jgi:hypothetical protein
LQLYSDPAVCPCQGHTRSAGFEWRWKDASDGPTAKNRGAMPVLRALRHSSARARGRCSVRRRHERLDGDRVGIAYNKAMGKRRSSGAPAPIRHLGKAR